MPAHGLLAVGRRAERELEHHYEFAVDLGDVVETVRGTCGRNTDDLAYDAYARRVGMLVPFTPGRSS